MNKTALAIATAASLTFFAGPLMAENAEEPEILENEPQVTIGQPDSEAVELDEDDAQAGAQEQGQAQPVAMDADAIMQHYDANNDGELDEEELSVFGATAAGQVEPGQLMQRLDQDGDGTVTKDELKQSELLKDKNAQGEAGATQ